jgi:hypothetical protein
MASSEDNRRLTDPRDAAARSGVHVLSTLAGYRRDIEP